MSRWIDGWMLGSFLVIIVGTGPPAALAQTEADDELDRHLATVRRQLDDSRLELSVRQRLAQETASALDRAAQQATSADQRRTRWAQAAELLDAFNDRHPDHDQYREFTLQAAVYLWAQGQTWARQFERNPADTSARRHAETLFDAVLERLQPLAQALDDARAPLAQNVRFRLAQTFSDRALLHPPRSQGRRDTEIQALRALDPVPNLKGLEGFAWLLRADLLRRLERLSEARAALMRASDADPPLPAEAVLEVQVAILIDQGRFDEAKRALAEAEVEPVVRDRMRIRLMLAQRDQRPAGPARQEAEAEALALALALLDSEHPDEGRAALIELARTLTDPPADLEPEAFEALAQAHLALGQTDRASECALRGAARAEALDRPELAANLRYQAGAIRFQAHQFEQADAVLTDLIDDPRAGSVRPKAALLRILGRQRALLSRDQGWLSVADYLDALEDHLRAFPDDPTTGEVLWLLGQYRFTTGQRDQARELWSQIAAEHPRWLEAQLTIASALKDALETHLISGGRQAVARALQAARDHLDQARSEANNPAHRAEIELGQARLELTPGAGRPEEALRVCERLARSAPQARQRARAQRLQIIALAQQARYLNAEQMAREHLDGASLGDLIELARLLDRTAMASDSDLARRRLGQLLLRVTEVLLRSEEGLANGDRAEARLRHTRALTLRGDHASARHALDLWSETFPDLPWEFLPDLARTYVELGAFDLAIEVYRLRMRQVAVGSPPWFEARYGLALAYFRSGRAEEARRLIDATAILYPDLGGGDLQDKFERLRRRLDSPSG